MPAESWSLGHVWWQCKDHVLVFVPLIGGIIAFRRFCGPVSAHSGGRSLEHWTMTEVHIGLSWWPPSPDEPIGADRAHELVERLEVIADPVVQAAEADLRQRIVPDTPIVWSMDHHGAIAKETFNPEVTSLCVGVVYQDHSANGQQNAIQLGWDGVLRWKRY